MKTNKQIGILMQQQNIQLQNIIESENNNRIFSETPAFPLATNVAMPEGHKYPNGDVSLKFRNFSCSGLDNLHLDKELKQTDKEAILFFNGLTVVGEYAIMTKYAPVVDIDTAGNLMPFSHSPNSPLPAGSEAVSTIPEAQQTEMLANARLQRDKLSAPDNPNGQKLMGVYSDHNEVYNELFQNNAALLSTWKQGNAVAQMAQHTNTATKDTSSNIPVNDSTKTFGDPGFENSYNGHSFVQQNAVIAACIAETDWWGGDLPDNQYTQAALATLNFKKTVGTTGNDSSSVTPLTSDQIHSSVKDFSGTPPVSTLPELLNQVNQIRGTAGAAEIAAANGWDILNEAERKQMNYMLTASWEDKLSRKNEIAIDLWVGKCITHLKNISVQLKRGAEGQKWIAHEITMPSFELDIDDTIWMGETGDIVKERLEQIYFVRSLINEKVKTYLKSKAEMLITSLSSSL